MFLSVKWCTSRSNNRRRSHNQQCLFSHRLEPPSDRQPRRSPLHEKKIHFFFLNLRLCSCHLPTKWQLSLILSVARPSCSTVLLQDVADAARRLFLHLMKRPSVLHQPFQLMRSYSRLAPVLRTAVATDLTRGLDRPQHSHHPQGRRKWLRKMMDGYFFFNPFKKFFFSFF